MSDQRFTEADWQLFRTKIAGWQEAFIARLNQEYVSILSREGSSAESFWEVEKRIRKDRRKVGVACAVSRSAMPQNIVSLVLEGAITLEDLEGFSVELREYVQQAVRL